MLLHPASDIAVLSNLTSTLEEWLHLNWLRELDLNQRPSGYEPDELPCCSIPRPILLY